jgi:DNA-binding transcriptional regulator YdaS (Cro superfamily)
MDQLKNAIAAHGGLSAAAALLGITASRLSNWVDRGVPTDKCATVEAALGVSRQLLRPDDWSVIWPELSRPRRRA